MNETAIYYKSQQFKKWSEKVAFLRCPIQATKCSTWRILFLRTVTIPGVNRSCLQYKFPNLKKSIACGRLKEFPNQETVCAASLEAESRFRHSIERRVREYGHEITKASLMYHIDSKKMTGYSPSTRRWVRMVLIEVSFTS